MAVKDTLATLYALKMAQEKAENKEQALDMISKLIHDIEKNK